MYSAGPLPGLRHSFNIVRSLGLFGIRTRNETEREGTPAKQGRHSEQRGTFRHMFFGLIWTLMFTTRSTAR